MGFRSPWLICLLGVGFFLMAMSAAFGPTPDIGLLFGGLVIVIVCGIALFLRRKKL